MRRSLVPALLTLSLCLGAREHESTSTTSVHLRESRLIGASQLKEIESISLRLLASANFNTDLNADTLKESVPKIHERYREALAGNYVLLRFQEPTTVKTVAGEVLVYDVVIGIGPQHANAVFTIDETGRVVAHEKYSGEIAIELRDAVMKEK